MPSTLLLPPCWGIASSTLVSECGSYDMYNLNLKALNMIQFDGNYHGLGLTQLIGELLAHEVLQSLKGTENAWLIDLLLAFNW